VGSEGWLTGVGAKKCVSELVASAGISRVGSVGVGRLGLISGSPEGVGVGVSATFLDLLDLFFLSSIAVAAGPLVRATRAAVEVLLDDSRERGSWGDLGGMRG